MQGHRGVPVAAHRAPAESLVEVAPAEVVDEEAVGNRQGAVLARDELGQVDLFRETAGAYLRERPAEPLLPGGPPPLGVESLIRAG
jgi:hypothetical protein